MSLDTPSLCNPWLQLPPIPATDLLKTCVSVQLGRALFRRSHCMGGSERGICVVNDGEAVRLQDIFFSFTDYYNARAFSRREHRDFKFVIACTGGCRALSAMTSSSAARP